MFVIPSRIMDLRQTDNTLFRLLSRQIKCISDSRQVIISSLLGSLPFRGGLGRGYYLSALLRKFFIELLFRQTGLILAVLLVVHSEFKQFLVVLSAVPTEFFHLLDILRKHIGIERLRVVGIELHTLLFRQLDDLRRQRARQLTGLTEYFAIL